MAEVRITKAMRFAEIREFITDAIDSEELDATLGAEMVAFIDHEVDLLGRKHNVKGAKTADQMENEKYKAAIADLLSDGTPMKSTDIGAAVGISVQKSTALLRQMVLDETVKREKNKKDVTFTV